MPHLVRVFRSVGQNESRLARFQELQLLADLHLLLARALLQAADPIAAVLDLAGHRRVLILQVADLAAFLQQRLHTLRPAHGDPGVRDHDGEQNHCSLFPHDGLADLFEQRCPYLFIN